MPKLFFRRGSRANLDALALTNGLLAGEPYLTTDGPFSGLAVGVNASSYRTIGSPRWFDNDFHLNATGQVFGPAAISAGTTNTGPATLDAKHPGLVLLRCATTANGGYRWQSSSNLRGGKGVRFVGIVRMPPVVNAGTTIRLGLHDATTSTDAVDGAYVEIVNTALTPKTASNSVRTSGTALTVAANDWLTVDITYVTDTSVRFVVANDAGTVLTDQTLSANVPNTDARAFFAGIVATNSGVVAADLVLVDYMGVGF